ncbi:hypothetical protein [Natronorubrum halophilum]|uniref:hypothetical protein n=1 Tax=Natronorubrum halophilum TaxID=1702106 RepID=UPI0010C174FE|nr:hypothetical protein [Natronorubrum halophilum]
MSSQQYADSGSRLQWPDGYERTPANNREAYPGNISLNHREAFESVVEELERWGKTDVEIETAGTMKSRKWPRTIRPIKTTKLSNCAVTALPAGRSV